ncbi:hypothetical protein AB0A77_21070 [Streptomyces varsoviensis]|uniref:hypothetical protein n=1 Tax=Streptomyces varsoviensis TaxID=67373 RepID=UPI0033C9F7CA
MPEVTVNGRTFTYYESRTGSRAVGISANGVANSQHEYRFRPDPHTQRDYNSRQAEFYRAAAEAAAGLFTLQDGVARWPSDGTFSWRGQDYDLETR